MPGTPETEFTPEHEIDTQEHSDELDRIADDAKTRDAQRTHQILADVIQSQVKLTNEISSLVSNLGNIIARDALQPKLAQHDAEVVTDSQTGGKELAARTEKVDQLLDQADQQDANNKNGAAKESKFSKLAAGATVLVGLMPFMQNVFQVFVKAANGTLTAADLADVGDRAVILGLVQKWENESDADYWKDFANFYQVHNAATQIGSATNLVRPDPTSADLALILNLTAIMNPVSATNPPPPWKTAKDKADKVDELTKAYDPSSLAGKVSFITGLAGIKVYGKAVPRGVQAELGTLAVANKVMP